MFFKQHQILIKTDTAVQAPCSPLLTEAVRYLHMILNKAGSTWHHYYYFDILLPVCIITYNNPAW